MRVWTKALALSHFERVSDPEEIVNCGVGSKRVARCVWLPVRNVSMTLEHLVS
jgi:hypothetical protein